MVPSFATQGVNQMAQRGVEIDIRGGTSLPDRSASDLALSSAESVYCTLNQAEMAMLELDDENDRVRKEFGVAK